MTRKHKKNVAIGEAVRIAVTSALQQFYQAEDQREYEFPSSFTAEERAFIHKYCLSLGLKSKSRGKGANRFLTAYKKAGSTIVQADASFTMGPLSCQYAVVLLQKFPVNISERQDLLPPTERDRLIGHEVRDVNRTTARLNCGIPQVPPLCEASPLEAQRQQLPIWQSREVLVSTIARNQVTIVVGETGCGKTTQVPQYLLEHHASVGQPIRIICTEPRRLAAVAVAERVSAERNERLGHTVGYQIRLENRVSPKTLLTVCTNGILLRTLMGNDSAMATITHVIVDEVHERDRFSDFLLIVLRDLLPKFRNLKLILMSATVDVEHFVKYFGGCPVVEVPAKSHEVKVYFLEDVLRLTNYTSGEMVKLKSVQRKTEAQRAQLAKWCEGTQSQNASHLGLAASRGLEVKEGEEEGAQRLDSTLAAEMDRALHQAWMSGTDEAFSQLLYHFLSENVNVDHRHSETSATALMLAAGRGKTEVVEELLALGADPRAKASNDWTALDWAQHFQQEDAVQVLLAHLLVLQSGISRPDTGVPDLSDADREHLELYQRSIDDDQTDLDLVFALLRTLHGSQDEGAILVFLAGFDDMASLKEKILADHHNFSSQMRYVLCMLHSNVQCSEQRQVFNTMPPGVRKIILSTNIAETSITISDVSFVIDSGKVKEKSFDSLTGTTLLKSVWVSRASALQRKGRAGRTRPGVCFHLFSRQRFLGLAPFQQPELLRLPLQELCLQAKLLVAPNVPIADFLARAPNPPAFMVTRTAVSLLKAIDALDPSEQLTEMGLHLLDLPIDPQLGKMVLYSVVLKCLDPVLTIVCCLSVKDPFVLPTHPGQRRSAYLARRKLAADTYSDHMALLRAFQGWQRARCENVERYFCERHCISGSTMATILAVRGQLLGQLRASGFVRARGSGDIKDLNAHSDNWAVVKAALCAGSYPNLLRVDRERRQLVAQRASRVRFHTRSVLSQPEIRTTGEAGTTTRAAAVASLPTDWLLYGELARAGPTAYAHMCTLVSPVTVALFAGPSRLPLDALYEPQGGRNFGLGEDSDSEEDEECELQKCMLKLDDWVSLKAEPEVGHLALQLRQKLQALFLRRMQCPTKPWSQVDEAVVRAVVGVLTSEEEALGLPKGPPGIGQRPRPFAFEPGYLSFSSPAVAPPDNPAANPAGNPARRTVLRKGASLDYGTAARSLPSSRRGSGASLPAVPFGAGRSEAGAGSWCSDERSDTSSLPAASSGHPSPSPSPKRSPGQRRRFYVVKASSQRMVDVSVSTGLWSLGPATDRKVQWALKEGKEVVLVFSVQGSGHFQGYAQLQGLASSMCCPPNDYAANTGGRCYFIEWKHRCNLPFQSTRHLLNPWNENRKVQVSRDGQEIEPRIGEALCRLWIGLPDARAASQIV
ncbi:3'-5' RNA helicase YTHDC2 isoform X2 [Ixodes scapularis]|uniref:3'-5' RNA helicase YTHDC2 isoform X2 n=1 Tax=Ixodes scapularis TaxID=6945 RepID=UPI001C3862B0|nr:3'-5' RNA helicase YTHDC2 isoform X2 [Ixodes scapularis]